MLKRTVFLTILTALIAAAVWAIVTYGRPVTLTGVSGTVRDLISAPEGLYWIEAPLTVAKGVVGAPETPVKGHVTVRFLPRGRHPQPSTILDAYDIRSLVYHGGQLYALTETGPGETTGQLVRFGRDGAPLVMLDALRSPQGLAVTDSSVTWTEARPAAVAGIAHVPVMGALTVLRGVPLQGGNLPNGPGPRLLSVIESAGEHFTGQVLGVREGRLYWTERMAEKMPAERTFCRFAELTGGEPQTLGVAGGSQVAALGDGCVFWTDRSDELAHPAAGRTVWRRSLLGGEPVKLTDWLPATGLLAADGDRVYYGGGSWLWSVPRTLDRPRTLRKWGGVAPDALLVCDGLLEAAAASAGQREIARMALWPRGFVTDLTPGMAARAAGRRLVAQ